MLKHHGFLKTVNVSTKQFSSFLNFHQKSTLEKLAGLFRIRFLEFLKNELILHKEKGIYYFNRFNEALFIFRNMSHQNRKLVHVHILDTITNFERKW
ncbi:hypothetical protein SAMN06297358_0683 [Pedobacter xixiisoli]|uniref:Uncharacterized protein n=1 Tax=Pedobacter xixiisoli TaxID=1476464 RepID=A0A285ZS49_9SPHI|nr:hypothetical protein SAMN06297358_0683 [Pedobacter xixiisoli]